MSDELDVVCCLLDKLTLDSLSLMEEEIELKLNTEKAMCEGETNLAKSRYILGQNSVSALQLPNEQSDEFPAILKVVTEGDELVQKSFILEQSKGSPESKEAFLHNPLKWFGILVPQNLHLAQNMYRQAMQWIVKAANVQMRLIQTCNTIEQLNCHKLRLIEQNVSKVDRFTKL